ncbi:carboxypeptidase-like regulatory domain-containing protein [Pedobacter sp. LMG 31464]|uniref:Carboxypeptidase-like regulatory domain-containing protein n=1 Tax=Pedobacter planticolens TaxID=2679964 RepID=A0A923IU73_9SPHI|nr:DUF5686 and carboxypeptidase regulatory-like domain-containing protein [Pedobacter planticolens]MBB2145590.1 carboxypeptidase-like regulatory domain-containing protein [Pedobacter planticolens]
MNKINLLLILMLAFYNVSVAQQYQISGKITEAGGEIIPFASVYVKNTAKGVSANADGVYKLTLDKGDYTLVYKAIGFKTIEHSVNLTTDLTLNQKLASESYTLKNVVIRPNAEDPAYEIIRQAIKNRKTHLNEVDSYSSNVYIKGLQKLVGAPKKFFGRDIQKTLDLDTNRKGILYLSESQSVFSFKRPNKIHEEMVSSKVSGRNNSFSFNKASDLIINFYENLLLEGSGLSARSFVSPIADNALFYYKYKLLGTTEENGVTINKIEVIPRRTNDPVFRGIVYIADDSWRLMGTNLNLTEAAGINFVDTLNISQQFIKIENVYMPSDIKFQFNGNVLGFKFEGYYVGIYSNYDIHPNFPKNYFTAEILKVTKAVNKKDSLYWMNIRPIPLTDEEKFDYKKKDSIALRKTSKRYLDSVEKEHNEFGIVKMLLTGYDINKRYEKKYIHFDPIIRSVFYNTVEGFGLKYGVTFRKVLEDRKTYTIRPEVRYGFSNHVFTANLSGSYYYDPLKRASIGASFGSDISDLNRYGSMSLLSNSINTLLFERNLSKFYKKEFANINTTRELADGLQASASIDYNKNYTLKNTSNYKLRDLKDEEYTSNNPFTPNSETPLFPTYTAVSISAGLTYTIGQKYITRPDGKFYQESKYPRFQLGYTKGIKGILSSDVDYDLVNLEIYQDRISTGLLGYSSFVVGAGKFLNNTSVFYPDSKHFRGNNSTVFPPNLRKFRFLDFYQYSTSREYVEVHFEHNFAGFMINKIPLLRKLKLEEIVGVNYLTQPGKRNYKEFYFGVERLGFGASYGYAYDGNKKVDQGFRITYGF